MHVLIALILLMGVIEGYHTPKESPEGEVAFYIDHGDQAGESTFYAGNGYNFKAREIMIPSTEIQNAAIIKQAYDYSCGSAALATLLSYYLGEDLGERQVIRGLLKHGDSEKIAQRRAFSLLDMKKFVSVLGYKGVGYKAEVKDLETLGRPCILPLNLYKYRHFVVLKGIYGGHVFLADPWLGNMSLSVGEFKSMWHQNVIFVVYPQGARELSALMLSEEDLRFIDEQTARQILFYRPALFTIPEQQRIDELQGVLEYYKP